MRVSAVLLLGFASAALAGETPPPVEGLESARSLGHDFWLITVAQSVQNSFESIGHFRHCYYQRKDLGGCNNMSPSPSGKFAVYQVSVTGLVMFFDAHSGQSIEITHSFPGLLRAVTWSEAQRHVTFMAGSSSGTEHPINYEFGVDSGGT